MPSTKTKSGNADRSAGVDRLRPKVVVMDEFWRLLKDRATVEWAKHAFKLARERGTSYIGVLQHLGDLRSVDSDTRAVALGLLVDSETRIVYRQPPTRQQPSPNGQDVRFAIPLREAAEVDLGNYFTFDIERGPNYHGGDGILTGLRARPFSFKPPGSSRMSTRRRNWVWYKDSWVYCSWAPDSSVPMSRWHPTVSMTPVIALVLTGCVSAPSTSTSAPLTTVGIGTTVAAYQNQDEDAEESAGDLTLGWEVIGESELNEVNDVTAVEGGFVAVGSTKVGAGIWFSVDGLVWESVSSDQAPLGSGRVVAVAATTVGVVAVGKDEDPETSDGWESTTVLWLSPDARTWERIEGAFTSGGEIFDISVSPSGLVAVGTNSATDDLVLWSSEDGRAWEQITTTIDPLEPGSPLLFAASAAASERADGGLVVTACCDSDLDFHNRVGIWWSADGASWMRVGLDQAQFEEAEVFAAAAGPDGFAIAGLKNQSEIQSGAAISWFSADGVNWREGGVIGSDVFITALTWTGSRWLAGGSRRDVGGWAAFQSPDGSAWEEVHLPELFGELRAMAVGPTGIVAVGSGAFIAHSNDGSAWTVVAGNTEGVKEQTGFISITGSDSALYAVGADYWNEEFDGIWTSEDGRVWQEVEDTGVFSDSWVGQLIWWNDQLFAVVDAGVWRSSDGVDWERTPPAAFGNASVYEILSAGSGLVAFGVAGQAGRIWLSADGETWKQVPDDPAFFSVPIAAVAANPQGQLLAVGLNGRVAWSSLDGVSWARLDLPDLFPEWDKFSPPGLAATPSGWVLVSFSASEVDGGSMAWYSPDGTSWEPSEIVPDDTEGAMLAVAAVPQGLVAVGIGGIWVSDDGRAWELAPVSAEVPFFWGTDVIIWKDQVLAAGIGDSNPAILMRPNEGR